MAAGRRPGQSAVEGVLLITTIAAALFLFFSFIRNSVSSRVRLGADTFGRGMLYGGGQCSGGQALCWAVTVRGTYQTDTWDKDEVCSARISEDKCDPEYHCSLGEDEVCKNKRKNQLCAYSQECANITAYGGSAGEAGQKARSQVESQCGPSVTGCNTCALRGGLRRETGPTGFVCIREVSSEQVCAASCS